MTVLVAALVALAVLVWPRRARPLGLPTELGRASTSASQRSAWGVARAPTTKSRSNGRDAEESCGRMRGPGRPGVHPRARARAESGGESARWWRRRRPASWDAARTVQALDLVAAAVRAGCDPQTAVNYATARWGPASGSSVEAEAAGQGLAADASGWHESDGGGPRGVGGGPGAAPWGGSVFAPADGKRAPPGLQFVERAWQLSVDAGVPLADAIDVGVELLRADRAARSRLDVALAGPRATIRVLTLLPLAGPLLGAAFGVSVTAWLDSPVAVASLVAGLALMAFGRWWCARLIARVSPKPGGADPLEIAATTELLALVLRGGCGVVDGLERVAAVSGTEVATDLASVAAAVRWGMPWARAWEAVGPGWSVVARAVVLADALGVPPSGPLARAAADQRREHAHGIEIATARLAVRIVLPLGLAFLPAFVLLGLVPLVLALAGELWHG